MEFLIPSRTARPGNDPIFALNAEAKQRKAAGDSIVNATVGALLLDNGSLAVLPTVAQALRDNTPEVTAGYAPIAGNPAFLQGVIRDLFGDRPEAAEAVAVATPGGTGAIRHVFANFVEPQQTVLTSSYYWGPYKTLTDECDRHLSTFRMFNDKGRLDIADFNRMLGSILDSQGRALVILNTPCHNPTGYSLDADEWVELATILEKRASQGPITILVDVAYSRYGEGGLEPVLNALLPLRDKVLLTFAWSASKAFLEYGLRVGACVAIVPDADERTRVANALTYSCRGTWSNVNAGGMAALARVLNEDELRAKVDAEREELRALLDRRVALWNELARPKGIKYPRYNGGFFVTVFCDDAKKAGRAMADEGVFVVPLTGVLRVALCATPEADVARVVDSIVRHTAT